MKLQPRTTYRDGDGKQVMIAGLARTDPVDGEEVYWSIGGDHYTESGRFVFGKVERGEDGKNAYKRYTLVEVRRNLVEEDTSDAARKWWEGVKT